MMPARTHRGRHSVARRTGSIAECGCGADTDTKNMSAFSTDDADENAGTRPNFIARVVRSERDATDDQYQSDYDQDIDILYELEVLDKDFKNMYELGVNVRKSLGSKWMLLIGSLENIHGPEVVRQWDSLEDMFEFLDDKVYEFTDMDLVADDEFTFEHKGDGKTINLKDTFGDLENPPDSMLLPVREVTDSDELADLGAEKAGDVEEMEF